jgi:acylphosphatase
MNARLLVEGRVQGVGFRARAQSVATRLGIRGLVRNRADGRVEIFAECAGQAQLDGFVAGLSEEYSFAGLRPGKANRVEVFREGEANYSPAWKNYSGFEIDSGYG